MLFLLFLTLLFLFLFLLVLLLLRCVPRCEGHPCSNTMRAGLLLLCWLCDVFLREEEKQKKEKEEEVKWRTEQEEEEEGPNNPSFVFGFL